MIRLLNDHSVDNQFDTIEDFLESLLAHTIPLLRIMDRYGVELSKSYRLYELQIVGGNSFFDVLSKRGYPEISQFKGLLHKRLLDDPFWEESYVNQDCLDKAYELSGGLISFEHRDYVEEEISYQTKDRKVSLMNSYRYSQLFEQLRKTGKISLGEYLVNCYDQILTFCNVGQTDYFQTLVLEAGLGENEKGQILNDLMMFMERYEKREDLGRFSKNLEPNLHEFRTTITNARELRIIYCIHDSKIAFLNCFIKKQQKTPKVEIELGKKLRDAI